MSVSIKPTTSRTTPDPGQGGIAVTGPTDTGHAATTSTANGNDIGVIQDKSCIWSGVGNVSGTIISKTLKITHTSNGTIVGATGTNQFSLDYSLNGGGAWNSAVLRNNMTTLQGPTVFSVALPVGQDLTQVRVRDFIEATAIASGDSGSATVTISDIQVEVVTADAGVVTFGF